MAHQTVDPGVGLEVEIFVLPAVADVAGGAAGLVGGHGDAEVVDGLAVFAHGGFTAAVVADPGPVDGVVDLVRGLGMAGQAGRRDLFGGGEVLLQGLEFGVVHRGPASARGHDRVLGQLASRGLVLVGLGPGRAEGQYGGGHEGRDEEPRPSCLSHTPSFGFRERHAPRFQTTQGPARRVPSANRNPDPGSLCPTYHPWRLAARPLPFFRVEVKIAANRSPWQYPQGVFLKSVDTRRFRITIRNT